MDIKRYIDNGNLERYCFELFNNSLSNEIATLGSVHPEINQELNEIESVIKKLVKIHAITPRPQLKNRILAALNFTEDHIDINDLPPTNKYSNYESWLKAVEHLLPSEPFDDFFMEILRQEEHISQMLVVTKLNVPEEIHEAVAESFFILEGTCACTVGDKVFTLNAGDYLDIPLYTNHNIKILSPHVIAIFQHQF